MTISLNDENFKKEITASKKPVLVDFWAKWCLPCSVFGPVLEKIAEKFKEEIIFAKAELDFNKKIAREYGIDRIPTVLFFKDGKPIKGFIGIWPEEEIIFWLNDLLKKDEKK